MTHYRKVWQQYHKASLLPGIEIHHINGDHDNNHPDNLLAVTSEEHYYLHLENGDYGAASLISNRALLPINEVVEVRKQAGKIGGTNSRDNNLGFFSMSKEDKQKRSSKVGEYTRDNKLGIHAINADPELAKKNSANAGKISYAKKAGFHFRPYQQESVGGTTWWQNASTGKRKRCKNCPGEEWTKTMGNVKKPVVASVVKGIPWWNDGKGNRVRAELPPDSNWKRGMK
jgi:HNH endonuclease